MNNTVVYADDIDDSEGYKFLFGCAPVIFVVYSNVKF